MYVCKYVDKNFCKANYVCSNKRKAYTYITMCVYSPHK